MPTETMHNFSHRIDILAPQAYPDINDATALNSIKYAKLISVIPSQFRKDILASDIHDYPPAVRKATLCQDSDIDSEVVNHTATLSASTFKTLREGIHNIKTTIQDLKSNSKDNDSDYKHKFNNYHNKNKFTQKSRNQFNDGNNLYHTSQIQQRSI